jgi:phosphate/sulfate permease
MKEKKYPEGHFINLWMVLGIIIFSGFGIPISIATENPGFIGIGPALGVAVGLSIGAGIEAKMKKEGKIRSLTKEEKKKRQKMVTAGLVILTAAALLGLVLFLLAY